MDVKVQVVESSFIAPSEPTPRKRLWLSSLDLVQANKGHIPIIYLYYGSSDVATADFFNVARLKEAMAKALVAFYPLAGRIGVNTDGRMEITCNDEGALFVVAQADLTADDVKAFKPSPELRNLLVPRIEPSSSIILAIQVHPSCSAFMLPNRVEHTYFSATFNNLHASLMVFNLKLSNQVKDALQLSKSGKFRCLASSHMVFCFVKITKFGSLSTIHK